MAWIAWDQIPKDAIVLAFLAFYAIHYLSFYCVFTLLSSSTQILVVFFFQSHVILFIVYLVLIHFLTCSTLLSFLLISSFYLAIIHSLSCSPPLTIFLDAPSHLYMRGCLSDGPSVGNLYLINDKNIKFSLRKLLGQSNIYMAECAECA